MKFRPHHEDHEGNEESNTNLNFFPFVPFASFVVDSILSSLVAASPRWDLRGEIGMSRRSKNVPLPGRKICSSRESLDG